MSDETTPQLDPIDTIISEVNARYEKKPAIEASTVIEPDDEHEEVEIDENGEVQEQKPKTEKEVWPKKAVNAYNAKQKIIAKQKAELEQLRSMVAQQPQRQEQQAQPKDSAKPAGDAPNENDLNTDGTPKYDNYGEFLRAQMRYEARKEALAIHQASQQENEAKQTEYQQQQYIAKKTEALKNSTAEFITKTPDAQSVLEQYGDLEFPDHIANLFLEADNAPLAFYNLAKDGKLEQLIMMTPAKAAFEIGRAQSMNASVPEPKKISNAPSPPSHSAKGTGAGAKSADNASWDELKVWLAS